MDNGGRHPTARHPGPAPWTTGAATLLHDIQDRLHGQRGPPPYCTTSRTGSMDNGGRHPTARHPGPAPWTTGAATLLHDIQDRLHGQRGPP
ncbi:hypothetical protein CgunFtcFv8_010121 [Champsocephalus gunnari]|uniref:Uncharacterized protein n=1 Tax=Champsocephalus gunnari TaxID=52237 RepID=A0AAN8HV89_CHAGU|nr:hypothetical protein CgunFtcFv8_010121 [Champsocephalus gunnari]